MYLWPLNNTEIYFAPSCSAIVDLYFNMLLIVVKRKFMCKLYPVQRREIDDVWLIYAQDSRETNSPSGNMQSLAFIEYFHYIILIQLYLMLRNVIFIMVFKLLNEWLFPPND